MCSYQTHSIHSKFVVQLDNSPPKIELSDAENQEVERLWEAEVQQFGKANRFNGSLFAFVRNESDRLLVREVEFKHYVAQVRNPELKIKLKIAPVGISGVILWQDRVLLGKRSQEVFNHPGKWELVPAGSLSHQHLEDGQIDYIKAISEEFEEETGLGLSTMANLKPLLLVHDIEGDIWDVCIQIELNQSVNAESLQRGEYEVFRWETPKTIVNSNDDCLPTTLAILHYLTKTLF